MALQLDPHSVKRGIPAVVALCSLSAVSAQETDEIRFFETEVRPILAAECYSCHSSQLETPFAGLRLDSRAGTLKGGLSGPAVVPGDPSASKLITAVRYQSDHLRMPPTGRLPQRKIDALAQWVEQGAVWPEEPEAVSDVEIDRAPGEDPRLKHWAFHPVEAQEPPAVQSSGWPLDDLDRFIHVHREQEGLTPNPDADRHAWLRRVTFDLTGLPPTISEIEAFLADGSPEAYAAVVDRLLAAPEFGEKWARHWLDLSGYADNIGLGRRIPSFEAWRYRDWVIQALNDDKPFDEFVREQIAGDVLEYNGDLDRRDKIIATGFLAIGPWALVDSDKEQLRMDVVDNQIDTVGRALLGLTLGCARCHDHKFDPVSSREYYAMAGVFRSTQTLNERMGGVFSDVYRAPLPESPTELRERAEALERWQAEHAEAEAAHQAAAAEVAELKNGEAGKEVIAAANKKAADLLKEFQLIAFNKPRPPAALAVRDYDVPENAHVNLGGNPHMLGDEVPRGFLTVATAGEPPRIANRYTFDGAPHASSGRRELARWLTDPRNPLTARVFVNRVWHHLFGAGLVRSVDNFGLRGEAPSHPELLDFLAARFVEEGWSIKTLIREITLSRTYRLSSGHQEEASAVDPENRLLWRSNRRRLDAEAFRDAVLMMSGKLDRRRGGFTLPTDLPGNVRVVSPPFLTDQAKLGEERRYRRTVYLPTLRKSQMEELDVLNLFDFPDPNNLTGARPSTTVPSQALFLMNSPFLRKQSKLAAGALLERKTDDAERVRRFLLRAFGREARDAEIEQALGFVREMEERLGRESAWARWCHSILVSNEFLFRS